MAACLSRGAGRGRWRRAAAAWRASAEARGAPRSLRPAAATRPASAAAPPLLSVCCSRWSAACSSPYSGINQIHLFYFSIFLFNIYANIFCNKYTNYFCMLYHSVLKKSNEFSHHEETRLLRLVGELKLKIIKS